MKKTFIILFSVAVIIISFSIYYVKIHEEPQMSETTLLKSFNNSGAKVVNSEIYFWGKLDAGYGDLKKLEQLAGSIASQLGVKKDNRYSNQSFTSDLIQKAEIKGRLENNRTLNVIAQTDKEKNGKNERYVSVSVTQDLSAAGLEETKRDVLEIFKTYHIEPKVNSCITGSLDGKLGTGELNEISKKVFKQAEANKVEGVREQNLISVAAYSPIIDDYIKVNGKKVNLNLAIRYNTYENKTYIWLATPVISIEY